jgi:filamentous hemagglutinin
LTTATLTTSDIENHAEYSASSVAVGGGYSFGGGGMTPVGGKGSTAAGGVGTNQQGQAATGGDKVPGNNVASSGNWSATPPAVMAASGSSSSTTVSGVSGGAVRITDEAKQRALTGQGAEETLASLNRDITSEHDGTHALKSIFNEQEIRAGFEIVGALQREAGTFLANRAKASSEAQQALEQEQAKPVGEQDREKVAQLTQVLADNATWAPGGAGRRVLTALTAAAGGNVTGAMGQFAQAAGVTYLQTLGAEQIKALSPYLGGEGSAAHTALHAVLGCAGGAASGGDCGAGALGASAGVVLNTALDQLSRTEGLSASEKEARADLVASLVAGVAQAMGADSAQAVTAAQVETLFNRHLSPGEKAAIKKGAGDDEDLEKRLTRAACYEVKCWAQYKPGSAEYMENYVSMLEASQLQAEFDWVNDQKQAGLFDYAFGEKIGDAVKSDPFGVARDLAKVGTGLAAAKVGGLLCVSVAGCGVGASMFVFGTSDAIEGATSLHDRYYGLPSRGANPVRWGFNQISPKWGDLAYDGISFGTNLAGLRMPVPLNVGKADGLNRPTTMFDVNVRNINNIKLYPITKGATPAGTHQSTLLFGVGSKGLAVVDDIHEVTRPE